MKFSAWVLIFFSACAFCLAGVKLYEVHTHPIKFKDEIVFNAEKFELTPELVASVKC